MFLGGLLATILASFSSPPRLRLVGVMVSEPREICAVPGSIPGRRHKNLPDCCDAIVTRRAAEIHGEVQRSGH